MLKLFNSYWVYNLFKNGAIDPMSSQSGNLMIEEKNYNKNYLKWCKESGFNFINYPPGMIFPLNLTQASAHCCPSKYEPYIFLHWAQFRKQTPKKSNSPAESIVKIEKKGKCCN